MHAIIRYLHIDENSYHLDTRWVFKCLYVSRDGLVKHHGRIAQLEFKMLYT